MNRPKLFSAVILLLLLLCFITGCGLFSKPEKVVIEELDAVKDSDGKTIAKYLSSEDIFGDSVDADLTEEAALVFDLLMKDFNYEIQDTEKSLKKATVTVKITTLDMKSIVRDYQKELLSYIMTKGISDLSELNTHQLFTLLKETLEGEYKAVTKKIEVRLKRQKDGWVIQSDDRFTNAITGNISDYLNDPEILTAEEAATVYLASFKDMDTAILKQYLFPEAVFSDDGTSEEILCNKIKENYKYEIKSVTEDGNTAAAEVAITNINLAACLPRYKELITEYAKAQGGIMPSQEAIEQAAASAFTTAFEQNAETKVIETTVTFTRTGTMWLLKKDDALLDALMGGFTDFETLLAALQ